MTSAIRIAHLSVRFGGQSVLADLNLVIPAKGLTFLLGRSGSGKTTLLRAINRLNECLPGCETQGQVQVRLGGAWVDVYAPSVPVESVRRRIGMVFQTPNVLPLSLERNISLPLEAALSLPSDVIHERVERVLREVHLWDEVKDRLKAPAVTLSGGQQQRLCLARALALEPEILLLDEPTASLDFKASQQIESLLLELKSRYTLLVVSHSLGQAHRLADNVLVLRDGQRVDVLPPGVFQDKTAFLDAMDELM